MEHAVAGIPNKGRKLLTSHSYDLYLLAAVITSRLCNYHFIFKTVIPQELKVLPYQLLF